MPTETQYTGNYIGKSLATIGLTQQLETGTTGSGGINTQTILGVGDKYMIDLYGSLQTHRPEETPMLTIMESLGTESCNAPYFVWTDEYKGVSWWDISLDTLRQKNTASTHNATTLTDSGYLATIAANTMPVAMNATTYGGGIMMIQPVTSIGATTAGILGCTAASGTSPLTDMTLLSTKYMTGQAFVPANATANVVMFAIKDATTNIGSTDVVWNKLRVLLSNVGYTEYVYTGVEDSYIGGSLLRYSSAARVPVYMAFPNISVYGNGSTTSIEQYSQVIARVEAVWYGKITSNQSGAGSDTADYLIFAINFSDCNESINLSAYNGSSVQDSVMVGQPAMIGADVTTTYGTNAFGASVSAVAPYAGSISRMLLLGNPQAAPLPIPEGDKFSQGGNMTQGREQYMNNTQIFVSPAYGVTGTHQASSFRFGDDFQLARDLNFSIYKKRMQAAFMYGIKYETVASGSTTNSSFMTGQPVRATSGLMDYAMFPIRHIKMPLATPTWGDAGAKTFIVWLDKLGNNLAAFRQAGTKSLTFMVSQKFINKVNIYIRSLMGGSNNYSGNTFMGGLITFNKPSSVSFGLEYYEYTTTSGVLMKFIHDPGMDNSPSIQVPRWIYGTASVSPRDLLFSIDPKNMKRKVLRPDKIYGNIQDIGQDAFLEAIRGESGFMLRFPMNHAIVYAPES